MLALSPRLERTQTAWIEPGTQPTRVSKILMSRVALMPSFRKILTGGKTIARMTLKRFMIFPM